MLTKIVIERAASGIFLLLVVAIFVSLVTDIGVDPTRLEFRDSLESALADRSQYLTSSVFVLISSVLWVVVAGALYSVFRSHDRTLALMGSFGFLAVGVTFLITASTGFALVDLAEEFAEPDEAEAGAVYASARAVAFLGNTSFFGLFIVLPFALLSYGALITFTKAVAVWLGWLALVVAAALLVTAGFWISGFWDAFDMYVMWDYGFIAFLGVMVWLILMGGWILWRGTREAEAS